MVELLEHGAYLLHGAELVEDNDEAAAALKASKREAPLKMRYPIARVRPLEDDEVDRAEVEVP